MHYAQLLVLASAGVAFAAPRHDGRVKRDGCGANAPGISGYSYSPDTADGFAAAPDWNTTATSVATPSGYDKVFTGLQASNNANDYRGYYFMDSYDTAACAQHCNDKFDCRAFNILFERNPSVNPGPGCDDPSSVTYIKCVLWAGPVNTDNANNVGFLNDQFQVLIAGSNGYISTGIADPVGYTSRVYFGSAAISHVADQVGDTRFQGRFDAQKCADECTTHTNWAADKPAEKACKFFNTYYQYINDGNDIEGQICVMYAAVQDSSYATNTGQLIGNGDQRLITDSYGWSLAS